MMDHGAGFNLYVIPCAAPSQDHVIISRREERRARDHGVVVLGLLDVDLAETVETFGEGGGEIVAAAPAFIAARHIWMTEIEIDSVAC